MKVGDQWRRLKCIEVKSEWVPLMLPGGPEGIYNSGDGHNERVYRLQCECGKEFSIGVEKFLGKRKMHDCGCGIGRDDGMIVSMMATVPLNTRRMVQEYAQEHSLTTSKAVVVLIERGIKAIEGGNGHGSKI